MKVGVISDTHDHLETLSKAMEIFRKEKVSLIIHCGDWISPPTIKFLFDLAQEEGIPIKAVFGNNPGDVKRIVLENVKRENPIELAARDTLVVDLQQRKGVIYHGQDAIILEALINCQAYDVIFTGHTHAPRNEVKGKTLIINPGSTNFEREGKITGEASVAIYDSTTNTARIITFE